jgi:hypothetical protein
MENKIDFFLLVQELKEKIEKYLKEKGIGITLGNSENKTLRIFEIFITLNITCEEDIKIFFVIRKEDKSLIYRVVKNEKNLQITKEYVSIDYFVANDLHVIANLLKS